MSANFLLTNAFNGYTILYAEYKYNFLGGVIMNKKGNLSIDSENIFPIIKKWLYSDQDIYIRELISNGVDAIQKRKKLSMLGEVASDENVDYQIHVVLDPENKTITVSDNGIGMTADEVEKYITQIAFSGATEFLEKYKDAGEDTIIGHFGPACQRRW